MENFDPDLFRAPQEIDIAAAANRSSTKPPRHRKGEEFVKGPIPWLWLERAMMLPGKALHAAMLLWKAAGIRKNRTVRLNLSATKAGWHRDTIKRGLRGLATAELVTITHKPGQALEVTLLDAPEK